MAPRRVQGRRAQVAKARRGGSGGGEQPPRARRPRLFIDAALLSLSYGAADAVTTRDARRQYAISLAYMSNVKRALSEFAIHIEE